LRAVSLKREGLAGPLLGRVSVVNNHIQNSGSRRMDKKIEEAFLREEGDG